MNGRTLKVEKIAIEAIDIPEGRRVPTYAAVDAMVASIKTTGLRQPITIRHFSNRSRHELVAGAHRLAAAKKLKWPDIDAFVAAEDDVDAELWEFDENLCRVGLTEAEEAAAVTRRKEIYERLHPETVAGAGTGGKKKRTKNDVAKLAKSKKSADRFTADTAKKTGKKERTIQRAANRGKKIGADNLDRIAHTPLDKGVELDALAKKSKEEQAPIIEAAARGEQVTARRKKEAVVKGEVQKGDRHLWNALRNGLLKLATMPPADEMARIAISCDRLGLWKDTLENVVRFLTEFRDTWELERNAQHARAPAETVDPVEPTPVGEQPTVH
jgi:ParB-like chromosome segregation protein Spo0J